LSFRIACNFFIRMNIFLRRTGLFGTIHPILTIRL